MEIEIVYNWNLTTAERQYHFNLESGFCRMVSYLLTSC